jgi:hypothetical protein
MPPRPERSSKETAANVPDELNYESLMAEIADLKRDNEALRSMLLDHRASIEAIKAVFLEAAAKVGLDSERIRRELKGLEKKKHDSLLR